eukprot:COSAG01_NODE_2041_length_8568_cov_5.033180_14_plen_31_part_01
MGATAFGCGRVAGPWPFVSQAMLRKDTELVA